MWVEPQFYPLAKNKTEDKKNNNKKKTKSLKLWFDKMQFLTIQWPGIELVRN